MLLLKEALLLFSLLLSSLVSLICCPAQTFTQLHAELSQKVIGIKTDRWGLGGEMELGWYFVVGLFFCFGLVLLRPAQFPRSLCFVAPQASVLVW